METNNNEVEVFQAPDGHLMVTRGERYLFVDNNKITVDRVHPLSDVINVGYVPVRFESASIKIFGVETMWSNLKMYHLPDVQYKEAFFETLYTLGLKDKRYRPRHEYKPENWDFYHIFKFNLYEVYRDGHNLKDFINKMKF